MNTQKGFTLTEILLAVMIVGLIGVALASLTTAASRESAAGNTRAMLRNNLSIALRQLRQDVHEASRILYVKGPIASISDSDKQPLLVLVKGKNLDDVSISEVSKPYVSYCFTRGNINQTSAGEVVQPENYSFDGGTIERRVSVTAPANSTEYCTMGDAATWLKNVKFISSTYTYGNPSKSYPVPLFELYNYQGDNVGDNYSLGSILKVNLITELPSHPVVNEVVEEKILVTNGGGVLP